MPLISLVYTSTAIGTPTESELLALLQQARSNNMGRHLTGLLLYGAGHFMQAVEGEEAQVLALEQRLRADPRHRDIVRISMKPVVAREFPVWTMGFRHVSQLDRRVAETDILADRLGETGFTTEPTEARRLLLAFRDTMTHDAVTEPERPFTT